MLDNTARWMELCALAAKEQDSVKLLALTQEITRLLAEKARRINGQIPETFPLRLAPNRRAPLEVGEDRSQTCVGPQLGLTRLSLRFVQQIAGPMITIDI